MRLRLYGAVTLCLMLSACGNGDAAPAAFDQVAQPEVFYLVNNELQSIRLDGTGRRSIAKIGNNKFRTAWPRPLPDGRVAVLGDSDGAIYPYVGDPNEGRFARLPQMNVTVSDSLCGVSIGGEPRLLLTETPFIPTRTTLHRLDVDQPVLEPVNWETSGRLINPAPYADGELLVTRVVADEARLEIVNVAGSAHNRPEPTVVTTIALPYFPASSGRLPDGRIVYLRLDTRDNPDHRTGELWVVDPGREPRATGIGGVLALTIVGNYVVYEADGSDYMSDLIYSDLSSEPVNITKTPFVSEHLGWSN